MNMRDMLCTPGCVIKSTPALSAHRAGQGLHQAPGAPKRRCHSSCVVGCAAPWARAAERIAISLALEGEPLEGTEEVEAPMARSEQPSTVARRGVYEERPRGETRADEGPSSAWSDRGESFGWSTGRSLVDLPRLRPHACAPPTPLSATFGAARDAWRRVGVRHSRTADRCVRRLEVLAREARV